MANLNKKVFLEKFLERHPSFRWVHEIDDPTKLSSEECEEYEADLKLMRDRMLSLGLSDEIILEVSGLARLELKKMKNEK